MSEAPPIWSTRDKIDRAIGLGATEKAVLHFVDRWPDGYYRSTIRMSLAIGVGERAARAAVASATKSGWLARVGRRLEGATRSVLVVTPPADAVLFTEEQIVALEEKAKSDARNRQTRCRERHVTADSAVTVTAKSAVTDPAEAPPAAIAGRVAPPTLPPAVTAESAVTVTDPGAVTGPPSPPTSRQMVPHVTADGAARHGGECRDVTATGAVDPEEIRIEPEEPEGRSSPVARATPAPPAPPPDPTPPGAVDTARDPRRMACAGRFIATADDKGWKIWEVLIRSQALREAEDADGSVEEGSLARQASAISGKLMSGAAPLELALKAADDLVREIESERAASGNRWTKPNMQRVSSTLARWFSSNLRTRGIQPSASGPRARGTARQPTGGWSPRGPVRETDTPKKIS